MCEVAILVGIDKLHEAFTLYHLAYRQRSGYLTFLRTDPTGDYPIRFRSESRYLALLQNLHLDF